MADSAAEHPAGVGNQPWLLKNSLRKIMLKKHRARMPYKRFSPAPYIFLVTDFDYVFRKIDFFNTHSRKLQFDEGKAMLKTAVQDGLKQKYGRRRTQTTGPSMSRAAEFRLA